MFLCVNGLSRVFVLDLGFGYMPTLVELLRVGMVSTCVIEKKKSSAKYTSNEEIISEVVGKYVGTIIMRKDKTVEGGHSFFLATQADTKHTSIMLST